MIKDEFEKCIPIRDKMNIYKLISQLKLYKKKFKKISVLKKIINPLAFNSILIII
jgi:hypothetical protein